MNDKNESNAMKALEYHKMNNGNFLRAVLEEALAALWLLALMVALRFEYLPAAIFAFIMFISAAIPMFRFAYLTTKGDE